MGSCALPGHGPVCDVSSLGSLAQPGHGPVCDMSLGSLARCATCRHWAPWLSLLYSSVLATSPLASASANNV
ncbi:hypothetical protein ACOMHN_037391 [Nucella lapillus]